MSSLVQPISLLTYESYHTLTLIPNRLAELSCVSVYTVGCMGGDRNSTTPFTLPVFWFIVLSLILAIQVALIGSWCKFLAA